MPERTQEESQPSPSMWPQTGVRTQTVAGALMWLIGASILLVRGAAYIQGRSWHAYALAAGL
ncbi:MAG: hypothetical protein ACYCXD_07170, partial [Coriobacteriia bacterium]